MSASLVVSRVILLLVVMVSASPAAVPKAITRIPFEIKVPGRYTLSKSLVLTSPTATAAITISCDDVILDLQDWTLECGNNLAVTTDIAGVRADFRKNITIRNGVIRGFTRGIYLEGNGDPRTHLVENIHADQCTFLGIQVKGGGSIIRRNRVSTVTGSTQITANRFGLHLTGPALKVIENEITGVVLPSETARAYGIYLEAASSSLVRGNRADGVIPVYLPNHLTTGLFLNNGSGASLLADNFLTSWQDGVGFQSSPNCVYRDNTALGNVKYYNTASQTDAGGNN